MRAFAVFLGLILIALACIGLLTYPAWLLLHPHFDFPFHRIGERIAMLVGLVGFLILAPRMKLGDRASLGYGIPRRRFVREWLIALGIGVLTMVVIVCVMAALGLRDWHKAANLDTAHLAKLVAQSLLSGLAVAIIEETALRGIIFTGIQRESGTAVAVVLSSLIFAATHFFAKHHIDAGQVSASSGWDLLAGTLHSFADPLAIADAFLTYFAIGVILAAIRSSTGHIASCIGLHAGWVWVMLTVTGTSDAVRGHPWSWLLSQTDGFVGWLVLAACVVMGIPLVRFFSRRSHATNAWTPRSSGDRSSTISFLSKPRKH